MAIVTTADALSFMGLAADDSYARVALITTNVDKFVKTFCARQFEVADVKETVRNNETTSIWLKEFPVVSVKRLGVGTREVATISNSNTFTTAIARVSSTGLHLSYDGGAETSLTFATYTTLTAMATAVNAVGSGWSMTVNGTYGSMLSSELILVAGVECIDNARASLYAPEKSLSGYELDFDTGEITNWWTMLPSRAPMYNNYWDSEIDDGYTFFPVPINIYVTYSAGYPTIPADLKHAVLTLIAYWYMRVRDGRIGVESCSIEGWHQKLADMPPEVMQILNLYKKVRI